jgi:uncharacterized protein GlcG (DUF336 family)
MRKGVMLPLAISLALTLAAPAQSPKLATKTALTLDAAKFMAKAAGDFAKSKNWNIAVAILDDGGHLLYFERNEQVQIAGIEVVMRKAESALKYRRPGKAVAERAVKEPHTITLPGSFPFEGGLPVVVDGAVIGSIGVTGATAPEDAQVAQAAIDALLKALGK